MYHTGGIYSQNCMMEVPRYTISETHVENSQTQATFNVFQSQSQDRSLCEYTVPSTDNVMERSIDDLLTSQSMEGRRDFPDFEMLDARIVSALRKNIFNTSFKREVKVEEQRAQKHDRFLRWRQIAFMIYDHFEATGAHHAAQGLQNDDVQDFDTRWDLTLLGTSEKPQENVLGGLYKMKLQGRTTSNCFGFVQPRIESR